MEITETNKSKIHALLKSVLDQPAAGVESVTIRVNSEFDIEPFIPYLLEEMWPHAVDPLLIADPNVEEDKISRAQAIISIVIKDHITGKFLDFGCGEGYIVAEAANKATLSLGYDIVEQNWNRPRKTNNMALTTNWDDVVKNGPYDFILLYDVLDHLKDEKEVVSELVKIRSVLSDKGKVFIRAHPWCSRHGTHLYLSINKAYVHMCLSEDYLNKLGYKSLHTIKVIHPLQTYARWFESAGFPQPLSLNIVSEGVEPFFKQSPISTLIKRHWKESPQQELSSGREFPEWQVGQQFVDYVLKKA